jgi:hypothetical protein
MWLNACDIQIKAAWWWDGATFVAGRTSTGAFHLPRAYTYAASMPSSSGDVLCMPAGKTSMEPARMHWPRLNDHACIGTEMNKDCHIQGKIVKGKVLL